jgi:hypothetical protein
VKRAVAAPPPKLFEPWAPPANVTLQEAAAIHAVANGTASPEQQREAMRFIVERVSGTYQEIYCPGENGNRDSAYAAGKRRVGLYLVSLISTSLRNFKDPDAAPTEQP